MKKKKPVYSTNKGFDLDISKVAERISGLDNTSEGLQGANPQHGSTNGNNFCINLEKNTYYCHRHQTGGDTLYLIALVNNLVKCEHIQPGYFKANPQIFKKTLKLAKEKYGYTDIKIDTPRDKEKKNDTKDENIIVTSKVIHKQVLYEQVYNPETRQSEYLGYDNGELIRKSFIEESHFTYYPIIGEELPQKALLLTKTATEYGSKKDLVKEIQAFIHEYVDIEPEDEEKATYYILLTWIQDKLNTIPYLRVLGDKGSGKSRFEDVVGKLCYKPSKFGGATRAAPIYRIMEKWHGTLVFDEFNLKKSDDSVDIIQILNSGFQKDNKIPRCDKGNNYNVEFFDPYGGKILAQRETTSDVALESRCITILMEDKRGDSDWRIPLITGNTFIEKRDKLREKLLMFRFKNQAEIDPETTPHINFDCKIQSRIIQSYLPFFVLFNLDEEIAKKFIDNVTKRNTEIVAENEGSWEGRLINFYLEKRLGDNRTNVTSAKLSHLLTSDGFNREHYDTIRIGKRMAALGFKSKYAKELIGSERVSIRKFTISTRRLRKLLQNYVSDSKERENWQKLAKDAATEGVL